ncbi:MAG: hypothetical protein N3E37_01940 [Candidatus Micrarchaeota archaeon]|nr:hypothetical protein [Candidatus Micrarchaeota archaeon]
MAIKTDKKLIAIVAAFANFWIPGSGYLILQKRLVFGVIMLASQLLGLIFYFTDELVYSRATNNILFVISVLLLGLAFAYDAYELGTSDTKSEAPSSDLSNTQTDKSSETKTEVEKEVKTN